VVIQSASQPLRGQLEEFSRVIGLAKSDPQMLLDYESGCKRLADAIIAADSVGYKNMFSQNEKESAVLCAVLGQDFFYLPPSPGCATHFARIV
jgi:hypothetical protein